MYSNKTVFWKLPKWLVLFQIIFLGIWARWLCRSPSLQSHPNVLPRLHKVNFLRKIFHICNYFIISLIRNFYAYYTLYIPRYLENPSQSVKWHWLSLCAASGAVLSKETGIMALAINIGYGLWFKSKWVKKMKQVFWADVLTVSTTMRIMTSLDILSENV